MSTKNCPYCDELIAREAIKCKHCHEFLWENSRNSEQNIVINIWKMIVKKWNHFAKIPENINEAEMQRKILENILFIKVILCIFFIIFILLYIFPIRYYFFF